MKLFKRKATSLKMSKTEMIEDMGMLKEINKQIEAIREEILNLARTVLMVKTENEKLKSLVLTLESEVLKKRITIRECE